MLAWLGLGVALAQSIDVNGAPLETLATLPGLGPIKARSLAEWRVAEGPCTALADLEAVPGFGPGTVRGLQGVARCGDGVPEPLAVATHPLPPVHRLDAVDINRADVEALMLLPAMSDGRARRLIEHREREGDFVVCRDATRVAGIGPATIAVWGERCTAR